MFKQVSLIRCLITIAAQKCGRLARNNFADEKRKPQAVLNRWIVQPPLYKVV
jgi:hypothetical protein